MKTRFYRYNKEAQLPERMHYSDTGADIYMPENGIIHPGTTKVIPLGFGIEVPNGYNARLQIRTSIAKHGIFCQGCAIDAGYTGEIHLILHNISCETFQWKKGDRLAYIEMYPCVYPEFVDTELEERYGNSFGSSGK